MVVPKVQKVPVLLVPIFVRYGNKDVYPRISRFQ